MKNPIAETASVVQIEKLITTSRMTLCRAFEIIEVERRRSIDFESSHWTWAKKVVDSDGTFGIYDRMTVFNKETKREHQEARCPRLLWHTECCRGGTQDPLLVSALGRALVGWAQRNNERLDLGGKTFYHKEKWHPYYWEKTVWENNALLVGRWWAEKGPLTETGPFGKQFIKDMAKAILDWWRRCLAFRVTVRASDRLVVRKAERAWTFAWVKTTWTMNGGGSKWEWRSEPQVTFGRPTLFDKLADAEMWGTSLRSPNKLSLPFPREYPWQKPSPFPYKTWDERAEAWGGLDEIHPMFVPDDVLLENMNPPTPAAEGKVTSEEWVEAAKEIIEMNKPEPEEQVRIVRAIVYEGPPDMVRAEIAKSRAVGVKRLSSEVTVTVAEGQPEKI